MPTKVISTKVYFNNISFIARPTRTASGVHDVSKLLACFFLYVMSFSWLLCDPKVNALPPASLLRSRQEEEKELPTSEVTHVASPKQKGNQQL